MAETQQEDRFREEVRRFFAEDYPREVIAKAQRGERLDKADHVASQNALNAKGWLGVGWPSEHGGTGWTPVERYIFDQELDLAGAAPIIPMSVIYIGPIICAFGTDEQKRTWLPGILESRDFWAQGYSEPEAGSDLASLRFSAVRDGSDYVLNGTKIWTSGAHLANWIFLLARTNKESKKQDGISLICAPLDSPGITVHPIRLIDGSYELNRIEFDNVRVPVSNRIGEEGKAWHYANVLLKNERLSYAHIGAKRRDIAKARELARHMPAGGGATMANQPSFRLKVATVEARLDAIESAVLRALRSEISMATAAALKIACTECAQAVTELFVDLAGRWRAPMLDRHAEGWSEHTPHVPSFGPQWVQHYLFERAQTIYGGSTEIQKTIIWRSLGNDANNGADLDEEQGMLRHSLREWLTRNYAFTDRAQAAASGTLGQGWQFLTSHMDLLNPAGIGAAEELVVMEEAGRFLLAEPLGEALIAAGILRSVGGARARTALEALAKGEPLVLAWAEPGMRDDFSDITLSARQAGSGWQLNGAKALVVGAHWCKEILVAAMTQRGLSLFVVPLGAAGLTIHPYYTIDGRPAADLTFENVSVPTDALLGEEGRALTLVEAARDHGIALQSAEAAGLLGSLVRQTVAYTVQRRQFGKPIADFQALQHAMVDMFLEAELARAAAWSAISAGPCKPLERARKASAALTVVAKACRFIGQKSVQLHGGMGMTDELPLGHYVRRALMLESAWGDTDWHLERIASGASYGEA